MIISWHEWVNATHFLKTIAGFCSVSPRDSVEFFLKKHFHYRKRNIFASEPEVSTVSNLCDLLWSVKNHILMSLNIINTEQWNSVMHFICSPLIFLDHRFYRSWNILWNKLNLIGSYDFCIHNSKGPSYYYFLSIREHKFQQCVLWFWGVISYY